MKFSLIFVVIAFLAVFKFTETEGRPFDMKWLLRKLMEKYFPTTTTTTRRTRLPIIEP
uniref:Uncharacterized protein n=1 Tax=Anopheles minimus TaxID=112268 RepID=A0A182WPL6_9DIPT